MTAKKYEITKEEFTTPEGVLLHRIRALKTFDTGPRVVHEGDLGGWVENESNLSHEKTCWVFDEGKIYGNSLLLEQAIICDSGEVYGGSIIRGSTWITGKCMINDSIVEGWTSGG